MAKGESKAKPTKYAKELAQIAQEKWGRYKTNYVPAENFLIKKATDLQGLEQRSKDLAAVDYGARYLESQRQAAETLGMKNAGNVGSPSFGLNLAGYGADRGQALGQGLVDVKNKAKDVHSQNISNLIGYGQGQSAESLQGMAGISDVINKQSMMDAKASYAARAAIGKSISKLVGYGLGPYTEPTSKTGTYTSYNTNPNDQYKEGQ